MIDRRRFLAGCAALAAARTAGAQSAQRSYRIGIIGINGEWTRICLGQENGWVDGALGPYDLHIHPYLFLAMVVVPVVVGIAFFSCRGYRRRHENAA